MSPILVIAGKDLRQRLRDRSAIVLGFVAPLAIAWLMSTAFRPTEAFHASVGYVPLDRGVFGAAVGQALHDPGLAKVLTVRRYADVPAVRAALARHDVPAAVVVPAGFSDAIVAGAPAHLQVLTTAGNPVTGQITRSIADAFVARLHADRLSVGAALAAGAPRSEAAALAERAAGLRLPASVESRSVTGREIATIDYVAPGMGIFFVLFTIGFTVRSWFLEGAAGTLDRIAAAPVGYPTLLVGKAVASFGYSLASLGTVLVVSALAFGADWGSPAAVAALVVATSLSVVALTTLVMTTARTERQAEGLASLLTFALALAGGNFFFISSAPPLLRRLAEFTPNGWALRGFTDLATGRPAGASVGAPLLGIAACTAVVVALTVLAAARRRPT